MNQLHVGAKWLFRFNTYLIMLFLSIFLGWFVVPIIYLAFTFLSGDLQSFSILGTILTVFIYLILIFVVGEIYSRMAYKRWFYEFSDDGLRLERGVIWKRYSNVPYERMQNIDVHRGIIARMFGFSSLMIQTAGYSAQPHAEGYIPALDMNQAEQLRNFVMKKITGKRK